jgi:iron complex outermembrane recepter protein
MHFAYLNAAALHSDAAPASRLLDSGQATPGATPPPASGAEPGASAPLQTEVRDQTDTLKDVIVTGRRPAGSAITDSEPVAELDERQIKSLGASSLTELLDRLKPLTGTAGGGRPIVLLNGRRISSFGEIQSIPPEAIQKVEVLQEQDAVRFGYPPTAKLLNFITKRHFKGYTVQQWGGATTEGGGAATSTEVSSTVIDGDRRTSLNLTYEHQAAILQSQRGVVLAEPSSSDEAALADKQGDYRSLQPSTDKLRIDGTIAGPIGKRLFASLNLSTDLQRSSQLNGLADVPGASLADAILRQRGGGQTFHAGGALQGGAGRWDWSFTGTYDLARSMASSDQLVSAAAGLDIVPDRQVTETGTAAGKMVASGPLLKLPAGDARVTTTVDFARSTSRAIEVPVSPSFGRTTASANIDLRLPIASKQANFLSSLGRLNVNGSLGVSGVSGYRYLVRHGFGADWTPAKRVEFNLIYSASQEPPSINLLTSATTLTPNTPVFDFVTGQSVLVTAVRGGNPLLGPAKQREMSIGGLLTLLKDRSYRIQVQYLASRTGGMVTNLGAPTPELQTAFPSVFRRNASGTLTTVDFRPINIEGEQQKSLRISLTGTKQIKRKVAAQKSGGPGSAAAGGGAPSDGGRPSGSGIMIFAYAAATLRLADRLTLAPGLPVLDLLAGDTLSGGSGRPRWEGEGGVTIAWGPATADVSVRTQDSTRVRSDDAASDLTFGALTVANLEGTLDLERLIKRPWSKRTSLQFRIENILDKRMRVVDGNGITPDNFQPGLLDPLGRQIRVGLRKMF